MNKAYEEYVDHRYRAARRYVEELIREGLSGERIIYELIHFCGVQVVTEELALVGEPCVTSSDNEVRITITYSKSAIECMLEWYKTYK